MPAYANSEGAEARRRRRSLYLGVVLLAVVTAIGFVVRQGAGSLGGPAERFIIPYDASVDITRADRRIVVDSFVVAVQATRPIGPMDPIRFDVTVSQNGVPVIAKDAELAFNMDMDMGRHVYRMKEEPDGLAAEVTLPFCTFGGHRWYGRLRFHAEGTEHETVFLFDMP